MPAASASLTTWTGRLSTASKAASAGKSVQPRSMLAAVRVTPSTTTVGTPIPSGALAAAGVLLTIRLTRRAMEAMQASGVDGSGVATRRRTPMSFPSATSTADALIPLPPMSMPMATRSGGKPAAGSISISRTPDLPAPP